MPSSPIKNTPHLQQLTKSLFCGSLDPQVRVHGCSVLASGGRMSVVVMLLDRLVGLYS
jgi:hypothetical protein